MFKLKGKPNPLQAYFIGIQINGVKCYLHPQGSDYIIKKEVVGAAIWTKIKAKAFIKEYEKEKGTKSNLLLFKVSNNIKK